MVYDVDVCSIFVDKVIYVFRVRVGDRVERVHELSKEEYRKVNELLSRFRSSLTKILGINSLCLTYYGVDEAMVSEIVRYGKYIEPEG